MKKIVVFLLLILLNISFLYAQKWKKKGIPSEKPVLIIGIVVEQMRYDYLYKYWNKLEDNGFKRLLVEGTECTNAHFNYQFTQSGVGQASIVTGTTPSVHGIISQNWYLRLKEKDIYCTQDEDVKPIGTRSEIGKMSPSRLLVSTLGDEIKLATVNKSKVVGISMRDCSAVLSAGHKGDAAYWFDPEQGTWITSSYYMGTLPEWVVNFNEKKFQDLYLDREWSTLLPLNEYTESTADDAKYEIGFSRTQSTFPYDLKKLGKRNDYEILMQTPYGNSLTKDFAIAAIVNEGLGYDENTDFLSISFAATDYIGNLFGPASVEIEDAFLRLDKDIAHFLQFIDEHLLRENVLIYLTSDHGVGHFPEYLENERIPSGWFDAFSSISLLKSYLKALYGHGDWVTGYMNQQIYLNRNLIEDSKLSLEEIQNKTAQFMVQFSGVMNAVTATTLQTVSFSEGSFKNMQNSYNQKYSADVLLNLSPSWMEKNKEGRLTHNSAYTYDTHVPLIWYGWKVGRKTISEPVSMEDIAPTISAMLKISRPNGASGKPIIKLIDL